MQCYHLPHFETISTEKDLVLTRHTDHLPHPYFFQTCWYHSRPAVVRKEGRASFLWSILLAGPSRASFQTGPSCLVLLWWKGEGWVGSHFLPTLGGRRVGGVPTYLTWYTHPSFTVDRRTEKVKTLPWLVLRTWSVTIQFLPYEGGNAVRNDSCIIFCWKFPLR